MDLVKQHDEDHAPKAVNLTSREFAMTRLQALLTLLKPLADATDRLQGDGVTAAELHLTISTCYTQVKSCSTPE